MALPDLGFALTPQQAQEVRAGKDFVQLENGPFDLDLVFAQATNRQKDRESLPRLRSFRDYWKARNPSPLMR